MQTNTIQSAVAQGLRQAQRQSEQDRRRTARQGPQSGGTKAIYSALPAAQKAQYARELAEHYRSTQQESDDLSRQSAAKKSGKTTYKAGSSIHYGSSGRAHGGSSGSFGEALGYGKAIGGGIEAGLWNGAVREPLDLGASLVGKVISSEDTDTWLGKSYIQRKNEINAAFLGRLGDIWGGHEAGDGSLGQNLKDTVFAGYNSAFQNLLEGAGRSPAFPGSESREAIYLGSNALFHALKEYALPAITGSWDKDYNARWLTGKAYEASDRLTEKVSSIPGLKYVDSEKYQKDLTASTPSVRLAGNVSSVVANMLPAIGISAATGSPDAALVAISAAAAGNAAKEAYESGATPEQAYYIGLEKGYVEYLTERMFDALGAFGGGTLTPGMKSLLGEYAATKGGRALIKAGGILGEHVEEGVSDWAGTGIERGVLGHTIGEEPDKTLAQAMAGQAPWTEEGLVTLLSTLVLNGGGQIINSATPSQEKAASPAQQANEATYLRRMEEIGYLPPESSENAAREGAAEELSSSLFEGSMIESDFPVEEPLFETDEYAYDLWSKSIGLNDTVKTLAEYLDIKYNNPPRYKLIKHYAEDVDSGWISPLCSFENYERLYNRTQNEIVGQTAANGVVITGQSQHFLQRMVGTMRDPKIYREEHRLVSRSGVSFEDLLDALKTGKVRPIRNNPNGRSQTIMTDNCAITIDPDTGIIIQCNPK